MRPDLPAPTAAGPDRRPRLAVVDQPTRLRAFGLTVECDRPLIAAGTPRAADLGGRRVTVRTVPAGELAARWGSHDAEAATVLERRIPDGSLGMRVERVPGDGYRIVAPDHGDFVIDEAGELVSCTPTGPQEWGWQRPLFGQALPLAATLQSLELFHASAVAIGGGAVGFVGPSGMGKTSLAINLTSTGFPLVCDDVLSLEVVEGAVQAHPGVAMANVAQEQLDGLSSEAVERIGRCVGRSEKVHIAVTGMPDGPLPLRALYFVLRGAAVDDVTFVPIESPDPRELLGATFLPHVSSADRLMAQLETCSRVAADVPAFRLLVPWEVSAAQIARRVAAHAASI